MKILGNIIWLIFGGLHTAIEYFIAGLVLMITIIGIPFGLQSMNVHECAVVFRWRHLDLSHSHFLRPAALYYYHWNPMGKDAFPHGEAGTVTIRYGSCITVHCLSSELPKFN